jgi:hypothetical protein
LDGEDVVAFSSQSLDDAAGNISSRRSFNRAAAAGFPTPAGPVPRLVGGDPRVDFVGKGAVIAEPSSNLRLGQTDPPGGLDDGGLPAGVQRPEKADHLPYVGSPAVS